MKRIITFISMILILSALFASAAFAGALNVTDITPRDGEGGKHPQNMAVKVTFDQDMISEAAIEANKAYFRITDSNGVDQPFEIIYSADKYPKQLWLVLEQSLESNIEYTVKILPGIKSAEGGVLEEGMTTTFHTRNTDTDGKISLGLMVAMMVFMFGATSKAARKATEKESFEASGKIKEENLNPYKLAKIKGISLEEATAYVEKEKAKIAKRERKLEEERQRLEEERAAEIAAIEEELRAAEREAGTYRVSAPRSIKEAGGRIPRSVVKKNKAKREAAKAAERAAGKSHSKKKKKK